MFRLLGWTLHDELRASRLPKAALLRLGWSWRRPYFAKFRLANAVQIQAGWLTIIMRAPWLEQSARALHPHRPIFQLIAETFIGGPAPKLTNEQLATELEDIADDECPAVRAEVLRMAATRLRGD